jgi:hypothetical protein
MAAWLLFALFMSANASADAPNAWRAPMPAPTPGLPRERGGVAAIGVDAFRTETGASPSNIPSVSSATLRKLVIGSSVSGDLAFNVSVPCSATKFQPLLKPARRTL